MPTPAQDVINTSPNGLQRSLQAILDDTVNVLDFIPEPQHQLIFERKYNQAESVTLGIEAALAAANRRSGEERNATVLFPAGTYRIGRTLDLPSGVGLVGAGSEEKGAQLSFSESLTTGLDVKGSRIRIENLHFKGEGRVRHLLRLVEVGFVRIRYCYFDSPRQDGRAAAAIFGDSTLHLTIEHCHFAVANARSIDLLESNTAGGAGYGSNVSWIQHNTFGNCQQASIAINGDVTIRGNSFDSPLRGDADDDGVAILLGDESQGPVRIRDNYFELRQHRDARGPLGAVRVVGGLKALDISGNSIHGESSDIAGSVAVGMDTYAEIARLRDNWIDRWQTGWRLDGPDWGRLRLADNLYLNCEVPYDPQLASSTGPGLQTQLVVEDGPVDNSIRRPAYRSQAPVATVPVRTSEEAPVVDPLRGNHFLIQPLRPERVRLDWSFALHHRSRRAREKRQSEFAGQRLTLQFLEPAILSSDDFRLAKGLSVQVPAGAVVDFVVDHEGQVWEVGDATVAFEATQGEELLNTRYGTRALASKPTGERNSAFGYAALERTTTGEENTGLGHMALRHNREGRQNTAVGELAAAENLSGSGNTAIGYLALHRNVRSTGNVAVGAGAMERCTGSDNCAFGRGALGVNTDGDRNTAIGVGALYDSDDSDRSTAIGWNSLLQAKGDYNVGVGARALKQAQGKKNVALGSEAGALLEKGDLNLYLGAAGAKEESRTIRLGDPNGHDRLFAAGVNKDRLSGPLPVMVDEDGKLSVVESTGEAKEEVEDVGEVGQRLAELRPVRFRYRPQGGPSGDGRTHYGLIAEQVAETLPELVVTDDQGRPRAVLYHELPTLLLAEVQRLRRELEALKEALSEGGP